MTHRDTYIDRNGVVRCAACTHPLLLCTCDLRREVQVEGWEIVDELTAMWQDEYNTTIPYYTEEPPVTETPFEVMMSQMARELLTNLLGTRLLGVFVHPDDEVLLEATAPHLLQDPSDDWGALIEMTELNPATPREHLVIVMFDHGEYQMNHFNLAEVLADIADPSVVQ
jgi:hypothetical protein